MTKEVGRPSTLTEEVLTKIKDMLLDGKSEKEVIEELGIPRSTWYTWRVENYENFRTNVLDWRKEYRLEQADKVSDEIFGAIAIDDNGKADVSLLSLKQKEAQFIRETLGKESYSKRTEHTGSDGSPLVITFDESFKNKNATPNTTSETKGDSIQ
jgi:hypothetical protein